MKPRSSFGSVANLGSMSGSASTSGISQGSDELARDVSDRRITGVRYFTAIRAASSAASKQLPGVELATMGIGDSPWRPNIAVNRSEASFLVGIPVDGPARWT